MKNADTLIDETQRAFDDAFRNALAVPEDKVDVSPSSPARSVLQICKELAQCPDWATKIIEGSEVGDMDENAANARQFEDSLVSVEMCQAECRERLKRFYECARNFDDARLGECRWLPFNGGRDHTYTEMFEFPKWNFIYHLGQICYIQTTYGDFDEHAA